MLFHFSYGTLLAVVWLFCSPASNLFQHDQDTWLQLALLCIVDFFGMNASAIAYQLDKTAFLMIIGYSICVYSFLVDYLVLHAPISGLELTGALLILAVTVSTAIYKFKTE